MNRKFVLTVSRESLVVLDTRLVLLCESFFDMKLCISADGLRFLLLFRSV